MTSTIGFCLCDACRYARVLGLRTALGSEQRDVRPEEPDDTDGEPALGFALVWLSIGALAGLLVGWAVVGAIVIGW